MSAQQYHRASVDTYSTLTKDDDYRYLRLHGEEGRWVIISFEDIKRTLSPGNRRALAAKLTEGLD